MNLDAVTVNIRPRNVWEAMDAGFMLARQGYWKLVLLWFLAASPFLLLMSSAVFLPVTTIKWFLLLFWLCKPFYEMPLLNWISRALFGDTPRVSTTLREVRKSLRLRTVFILLFTRLSPSRSFSMPVLHLEGLRGRPRRERLALLSNSPESAFFLTASGFFIEIFLAIALLVIGYWLLPENIRSMSSDIFLFQGGNGYLLAAYIISCAIFAPFYTCAGFMMYISRRVELEAWDIEIGFRQMEQRLAHLKNGLARTLPALLVLMAVSLAAPVQAPAASAPDPQGARETITKVLQGENFGNKITRYYWAKKKKEEKENTSAWSELWEKAFRYLAEIFKELAPFLARYGKFILWFAAGIVAAFLLLKYARVRLWFGSHADRGDKDYTPPDIMFGMDLRPESLPEDIASASLNLLDKGRKREALSLLYRGALSRLVNHHGLEIHASFTEAECCDRVRSQRPDKEGSFFTGLTHLWVCLAYAHRDPDSEDCRRLVSQWRSLYEVAA